MSSLSELGNSLRCKCNNFAKITRQDLDSKNMTLDFLCSKCGTKFQRNYSINQYIRMAQAGLIDPPEIKDFQKKMIIEKGVLPRIDKGLDGAFIIDEDKRDIITGMGKLLLCKENQFYTISIKKFKKDGVELNAYCPTCTPKGKSINVKLRSIMLAAKAGLIDPDVMNKIRDEYQTETKGFQTTETYTSNDGTLAPWVQESLGMTGESKGKKCYICGSSVLDGISRCPKCGSDL